MARARTAQRTRNIHPYPRNSMRAVFSWKCDAANASDPGSIAPAAKANRSAATIGPAMLGDAQGDAATCVLESSQVTHSRGGEGDRDDDGPNQRGRVRLG